MSLCHVTLLSSSRWTPTQTLDVSTSSCELLFYTLLIIYEHTANAPLRKRFYPPLPFPFPSLFLFSLFVCCARLALFTAFRADAFQLLPRSPSTQGEAGGEGYCGAPLSALPNTRKTYFCSLLYDSLPYALFDATLRRLSKAVSQKW